MKLLEKLKSDPRVEEIWYEGADWDNGEGWWLSLKDGYNWYEQCSIHERNLTTLAEALRQVKVGDAPTYYHLLFPKG